MSTLKPSLDASLDLFMDVVLNPVFPEKEFERLQKEQINNIKQEKSQPITMALRVMNKYLYGEDHPYSSPYTGTGYEDTVSKLTREDVVEFYNTWFKEDGDMNSRQWGDYNLHIREFNPEKDLYDDDKNYTSSSSIL